MRTIQIQPLSLLAGAGLALLVVVAMGQNVVPNGQTPPRGGLVEQVTRPPTFAPHPRDYVVIRDGTPFVVPTGKLFVPTALGSERGGNLEPALLINGEVMIGADHVKTTGNATSLKRIPVGLSALSGDTVEVVDNDLSDLEARAWGYLVDE